MIPGRAPLLVRIAFLLIAAAWAGGPGQTLRAEDAEARADRFDALMDALNSTSDRRSKILETVYAELRGPDGREMQETLRAALSRPNSLILQGVIEAMAMLGDARDVASLEAILATSDKPEVKTAVIRLLPAFCLSSERARFNYINYAVGYERVARPEVLEPLRRPPLTRRGKLDPAIERLQGRVIRCLAMQFDPVGAALRYIDDLLYGQSARRAVIHFVGDSLGNDPGRWDRIWAAQGGDMDLRVPDEVEELRLAALSSLADMGAEALPEVIDAFRVLFSTAGEVQQQAAFDTMTVMCRSAFDGYATLAAMNWDAEDAVEAENWRRRRYASTANLAVYAADTAGNLLGGELETSVFTSAVECLGAALSFPPGYPDPEGALSEKREEGMARLERLLMMPDISPEKRFAVSLALGEIGAERAVRAVSSIIDSPYCSPDAGIDGTRMTETAIDTLRNIAVGKQDGRDLAREKLLDLLDDDRIFPPLRADAPPVGLTHMALWRMQRLARSNDTALDREVWKRRLGW